LGDNDTRKIVDGFNNQGVTWLIHMTGGEPFFYPNFVELCRELTHKHTISINSNLTHKDVAHFIKTINPKKVDFIHSSLHVTERSRINRIEDFVEKYRMLKDAGFNVFVSYLMYPSLFNRFEDDYQYFKSQGIILHPKVFWGEYSGIFDSKSFLKMRFFNRLRKYFKRDYPDSYAPQQKKFFKDFVDRSVTDEIQIYGSSADSKKSTVELALDKNWVDRLLSFTGRRCSAGRKVVRMEKDGEVYRCIDETQYHLGNMFSGRLKFLEEDLICKARICSCPYVGMRYVLPTEKKSWDGKI
jgi:MoaA/NifB/PqqE/SkfB family radical SAM enzyme